MKYSVKISRSDLKACHYNKAKSRKLKSDDRSNSKLIYSIIYNLMFKEDSK